MTCSTATVQAIAASLPSKAVPAPRAKPAKFQIGSKNEGLARYFGIKRSNSFKCAFSCSHISFMTGPAGVLPRTASCPA